MSEPAPADSAGQPSHVDPQRPWPGLLPFGERDRDFFFGRDDEAEELLRLVVNNRITLLYGLSGLGKTSLLGAGLFPRLRQRDLLPVHIRLDLQTAVDADVQVRFELLKECRRVGARCGEPRDESLWEFLHRDGNEFWSVRHRLLTPVLVFDQFEEIFSRLHGTDEARRERMRIIETIGDLAEGRVPAQLKAALAANTDRAGEFDFSEHRYRLLLTIREDYLADLEEAAADIASLRSTRFRLTRMRAQTAANAVLDAGAPAGLVSGDVALGIVRFVGESTESASRSKTTSDLPIEPALLSVVCRELNEQRIRSGAARITLDQLSTGEDILRSFYESGVSAVPEALRRFIEERLITADGVREMVAYQTFTSVNGVSDADIQRLIDARILHTEYREGRRLLELTHDRLTAVVRDSRDRRRSREDEQRREAQYAAAQERQREALAKTERELRASRRRAMIFATLAALALAALAVAVYQSWRAAQRTREAEHALAAASYMEAVSRLERGDREAALAYLARTLRTSGDHRGARAMVLEVLLRAASPQVLVRHGQIIPSLGWSGDGTRIFTASSDGTTRVWNAHTGAPGAVLQHRPVMTAAAWSPDGERLATGSDSLVQVWNARNGAAIGSALSHQSGISALAWSPDGSRLFTAAASEAVVWDVATWIPLGPRVTTRGRILTAVWSPDTTRIFIGRRDGGEFLDGHTGQRLGIEIPYDRAVVSAAWSPDSERVLVGAQDRIVRIWSARTGAPTGTPIEHATGASIVAWSPDGARLLTGTYDGVIRFWSASTGEELLDALRVPEQILAVQWSPDGARVMVATADNAARVWPAATTRALPLPLPGPAREAAWNADGTELLTNSGRTADIWNVSAARSRTGFTTTEEFVSGVRWSATGPRALTTSGKEQASVWDVATGERLGPPFDWPRATLVSSWSPDGARVLTASLPEQRRPRLIHIASGRSSPLEHDSPVSAAAWSPDGRRLATGAETGAYIWDAASAASTGQAMPHPSAVNLLAWSPDGTRLATASFITAYVWDGVSGATISQHSVHAQSITALDWSPDGKHLVTGARDTTARITNVMTGQPVGVALRHASAVTSVKWSPDGTRIITGSDDGTARVWDGSTGQPVSLPFRHPRAIQWVSWSPNGTRVVTKDQTFVYVWDVPVATPGDATLLASLAEAIAGAQINADGAVLPFADASRSLTTIRDAVRNDRATLQAAPTLLAWLFTDISQRGVSPLSAMTLDEYVTRMLAAGDEGRRHVERYFPGHQRLAAPPP